MGTTIKQLSFVSFEPNNTGFRSLVSLQDTLLKNIDWPKISEQSSQIYFDAISLMKIELELMKMTKKSKKSITARQIWKLGNYIFKLVNDLERLCLQIDGLYGHLERDLEVKRKWLEKVIILRRYLPSINLIPENLRWGFFEHSTRNKAEQLAKNKFGNEQ